MPEFTKELLDRTKVETDSVFEWAIWKLVYQCINNDVPKYMRRQKIINRVNIELDKWI